VNDCENAKSHGTLLIAVLKLSMSSVLRRQPENLTNCLASGNNQHCYFLFFSVSKAITYKMYFCTSRIKYAIEKFLQRK